MNTENNLLTQLDQAFALRYGSYASYTNESSPVEAHYGPSPADEIDRLLDLYVTPASNVLDLGCGAGFTLCRLAPLVRHIWGLEQVEEFLRATQLRVNAHGIRNATLILGNNADANCLLPDDAYDVGFSRRGPNLHLPLMSKLRKGAIWIQEFARFGHGLGEILGRTPSSLVPHAGERAQWEVGMYLHLGMACVSTHTWFTDQYFSDLPHMEAFLGCGSPVPGDAYDSKADRAALEVFARYNTTGKGIRLTGSRQVAVYRRMDSQAARGK